MMLIVQFCMDTLKQAMSPEVLKAACMSASTERDKL